MSRAAHVVWRRVTEAPVASLRRHPVGTRASIRCNATRGSSLVAHVRSRLSLATRQQRSRLQSQQQKCPTPITPTTVPAQRCGARQGLRPFFSFAAGRTGSGGGSGGQHANVARAKATATFGKRALQHPRALLAAAASVVGTAPLRSALLVDATTPTSAPAHKSPAVMALVDAYRTVADTAGDLKLRKRIHRTARVILRIIRHLLLFTPVILACPIAFGLSFINSGPAELWWEWLLWTVQVSGPAFIKFVQWASSRRDLFEKNICDRFSRLHASVHKHHINETKSTLTAAFGPGWERFLELDEDPVGSGCVAQVYRAQLTHNGKQQTVAVKVIHPYVQRRVLDDIEILRFFAWAVELVPFLKWTSAVDSVEEYSKLMLTQLDLRNEARNMLRFHDNFKTEPDVVVPLVVPEFASQHVLIESYEEGTPISKLFEAEMPMRRRLARKCVEHFFRMMFDHNFVHGDLHPGNLRVTGYTPDGVETGDNVSILLLDGGIATELSLQDRTNFIDLFSAIVRNNGREAGHLMLERARLHECPDPDGFVEAVNDLIATAMKEGITLKRVRIGELLQRVLSLMCSYRVKIESNFTAIMIGIMVAEGVGRSLDPEIDLLKLAAPILLREKAKLAFVSRTRAK